MGGTGGAVEVIISPEGGHGKNAVTELGGHFIMTATTISQAENDDFSTANDFRTVGIVIDPTTVSYTHLTLPTNREV